MATQFDLVLATYLDHLRIERGLSSHSIEAYRRDLSKFDSIIKDKNLDYENLSENKLSEIIGQLTSSGLALSSANRFISSLKGFYKYAGVEYSIRNPLTDIAQFKVARKLPKALSIDEMVRLISSAENPNDPAALRD
jgi:integrase/recombinase XerD